MQQKISCIISITNRGTKMNTSRIVLLLCFLGASVAVKAQNKVDTGEVIKSEISVNKTSHSLFYQKSNSALVLEPGFRIGGSPYPNPERNFLPSNSISYAGDINGDSKADFYYTVFTADETTDDPTDQITKMVILYGSDNGISEVDSDLVRDGFSFAVDVTGDGVPEAIRYEDDVLYLVVDESSGDLDMLIDLELIDRSIALIYNSPGDFNGDGNRDIIVYDNSTIFPAEESEIYIINGSDSLAGVRVDTLSITNGVNYRYDKVTYGDVDNDGTVELIQVSSLTPDIQSTFGLISVYQKNMSGGLDLVSSDTLSPSFFSSYISMRSGEIGLVDLNGNSNLELIISADDQVRILELDPTAGEYYSESNTNAEVYEADDFAIINDFNDNGTKELLVINSENVLFVESDAGLNLTDTSLPTQEGDIIGLPNNPTENRNSGGDVNGDGIADIVVSFNNPDNEVRGYRVHFGNFSGSLTDSAETLVVDPFLVDTPHYVFNAGDFNHDGEDDYGIVYDVSSDVHVFFGGGAFVDDPQPDLIFDFDKREKVYLPGVGDFNGDGNSDLLISKGRSDLDANDARVDVFFGGTSADNVADHTINYTDLYPDTVGNLGNVQGIGDINNDGFDDIMITSEQFRENAHIIFGGSSIVNQSDIELGYFPFNLTKLGDFNDDGIDDFATTSNNVIYIHSGFDGPGGSSFDSDPMVTIPVVFQQQQFSLFAQTMTHGDFNGDMINDLAVTSVFHRDYSSGSTKGAEAIRIYAGSSNPDSLVDGRIFIKASDYASSTNTSELDTLDSSLGSIAAVPDQNGDGKSELIYAGYGFSTTNAGIYYGGNLDTMGANIGVFMEAPNPAVGLSPHTNFIYASRGAPAVGDFNGDNKNDYLLPQIDEFNYPVDPVYIYTSGQFMVGNEESVADISSFSLNQNYPNPFNPSTSISYTLPKNGSVKLEVFDVTGRLVSTIVDQRQTAGYYSLSFDGSNLASGIYFYRLKTANQTKIRKMTLIK